MARNTKRCPPCLIVAGASILVCLAAAFWVLNARAATPAVALSAAGSQQVPADLPPLLVQETEADLVASGCVLHPVGTPRQQTGTQLRAVIASDATGERVTWCSAAAVGQLTVVPVGEVAGVRSLAAPEALAKAGELGFEEDLDPSKLKDNFRQWWRNIAGKFPRLGGGLKWGLGLGSALLIFTALSDAAGAIVQFVLGYLVVPLLQIDIFYRAPVVQTLWPITLGIANTGFLIALLVIALLTVLRVEGVGAYRVLPRLFLGAILVNFSLVVAVAILDFTRVVMAALLLTLQPVAGGVPLGQFLAQSLVAALVLPFLTPAITGFFSLLGMPFTLVTGIAVGTIVLLIKFAALFVVVRLLFKLVYRYLLLLFLLVVSPLAYVAFAFPGKRMQNLWSTWWDCFLRACLAGPAFLLLLLGAAVTLNPTSGLVDSVASAFAVPAALTFIARAIVHVAVFIALYQVAGMIGDKLFCGGSLKLPKLPFLPIPLPGFPGLPKLPGLPGRTLPPTPPVPPRPTAPTSTPRYQPTDTRPQAAQLSVSRSQAQGITTSRSAAAAKSAPAAAGVSEQLAEPAMRQDRIRESLTQPQRTDTTTGVRRRTSVPAALPETAVPSELPGRLETPVEPGRELVPRPTAVPRGVPASPTEVPTPLAEPTPLRRTEELPRRIPAPDEAAPMPRRQLEWEPGRPVEPAPLAAEDRAAIERQRAAELRAAKALPPQRSLDSVMGEALQPSTGPAGEAALRPRGTQYQPYQSVPKMTGEGFGTEQIVGSGARAEGPPAVGAEAGRAAGPGGGQGAGSGQGFQSPKLSEGVVSPGGGAAGAGEPGTQGAVSRTPATPEGAGSRGARAGEIGAADTGKPTGQVPGDTRSGAAVTTPQDRRAQMSAAAEGTLPNEATPRPDGKNGTDSRGAGTGQGSSESQQEAYESYVKDEQARWQEQGYERPRMDARMSEHQLSSEARRLRAQAKELEPAARSGSQDARNQVARRITSMHMEATNLERQAAIEKIVSNSSGANPQAVREGLMTAEKTAAIHDYDALNLRARADALRAAGGKDNVARADDLTRKAAGLEGRATKVRGGAVIELTRKQPATQRQMPDLQKWAAGGRTAADIARPAQPGETASGAGAGGAGARGRLASGSGKAMGGAAVYEVTNLLAKGTTGKSPDDWLGTGGKLDKAGKVAGYGGLGTGLVTATKATAKGAALWGVPTFVMNQGWRLVDPEWKTYLDRTATTAGEREAIMQPANAKELKKYSDLAGERTLPNATLEERQAMVRNNTVVSPFNLGKREIAVNMSTGQMRHLWKYGSPEQKWMMAANNELMKRPMARNTMEEELDLKDTANTPIFDRAEKTMESIRFHRAAEKERLQNESLIEKTGRVLSAPFTPTIEDMRIKGDINEPKDRGEAIEQLRAPHNQDLAGKEANPQATAEQRQALVQNNKVLSPEYIQSPDFGEYLTQGQMRDIVAFGSPKQQLALVGNDEAVRRMGKNRDIILGLDATNPSNQAVIRKFNATIRKAEDFKKRYGGNKSLEGLTAGFPT